MYSLIVFRWRSPSIQRKVRLCLTNGLMAGVKILAQYVLSRATPLAQTPHTRHTVLLCPPSSYSRMVRLYTKVPGLVRLTHPLTVNYTPYMMLSNIWLLASLARWSSLLTMRLLYHRLAAPLFIQAFPSVLLSVNCLPDGSPRPQTICYSYVGSRVMQVSS